MISLLDILSEQEHKLYKALVRVTFIDSSSVMETADVIRAVKGVTIVNTAGNEQGENVSLYDVKIRVLGDPAEYYKFVRQEALKSPLIKKFEIATKTIERV